MRYRDKVNGGYLHCPICNSIEFYTTPAATNVQMHEMEATFYTCQICGHILMFCKPLPDAQQKGEIHV